MTLTNQQVFDNALNQMRKQNYMRSYNPDLQTCVYRGKNGLKCAIGASIPDSMYDPEIEGKAAWHLLQLVQFRELFQGVRQYLLEELQRLHDGDYDEPDEGHETIDSALFESRMKHLALQFDLDYKEPA